jgi:hypothetical protein
LISLHSGQASPRWAATTAKLQRSRCSFSKRFQPCGLELIPLIPDGQRRCLGHQPCGVEADLCVFDHSVVDPVVIDLVGRLVVPLRLPLILLLLAPPGRLADVVRAPAELDGGHADLGKVELIRAVEESAVGELVRHQDSPLLLEQRSHHAVQ